VRRNYIQPKHRVNQAAVAGSVQFRSVLKGTGFSPYVKPCQMIAGFSPPREGLLVKLHLYPVAASFPTLLQRVSSSHDARFSPSLDRLPLLPARAVGAVPVLRLPRARAIARLASSRRQPFLRFRQPCRPAAVCEMANADQAGPFIPDPLPALTPRNYGSFTPVPGVVAERVTYATLYGMRVPAIVYRPKSFAGAFPPSSSSTATPAIKPLVRYYTGILYARAGAVVPPTIPSARTSATAAAPPRPAPMTLSFQTPSFPAPGCLTPRWQHDRRRHAGRLVPLQRPDVDPTRIAVAAFSMGTFHSAIAGAIDPRIHALVLSGAATSRRWRLLDLSPKIMCQSGPYKALRFLGDRGAVLYALNQDRGATFIITAPPTR